MSVSRSRGAIARATEIDRLRVALAGVLRETRVRRAYLFGSRATGRPTAGSDVDIWVEYPAKATFSLMDLCAIELRLQDVLRLPVHVLTDGDMLPHIRRIVERERVLIYGQAA